MHSLETFKIAQTKMDYFNLSLINRNTLVELDISYNRIYFEATNEKFEKLIRLKGENLSFFNSKMSFDFFLSNTNLTLIDFSNNDLTNSFNSFGKLDRIETLILKNVKLQSIDQLNLRNFSSLKYLDLSFNNLAEIKSESFKKFFILEYLDLSHNQIEYLDEQLFLIYSDPLTLVTNYSNLKFINLAFNRLYSINQKWKRFENLETLLISNNQLNFYPNFEPFF